MMLLLSIENNLLVEYGREFRRFQLPIYRMITFLWLVLHKRVMCNFERKRHGFTMDNRCMLCPNFVEDVNHIFQICADAVSIWKALLPDDV